VQRSWFLPYAAVAMALPILGEALADAAGAGARATETWGATA
jgi:hypothetical protein